MLCYVHMLVFRMVADVMRVMNNIKCEICSFYVRHNLTVGFPRQCAQYSHYFIRQLSAASCCQFTVLTWPTVPTANWRWEVTTESDERWLWDKIMITGLMCVCVCIYVCVCVCVCVCVWALLAVCSFIRHKRANGFVFYWVRIVQCCLHSCIRQV